MPRGRPRSSLMADDKPHGRMTAYAFFVQTCRAEHKKNHPDENVNFVEFSRQCSERWKTMSDQEKKRFHELADKDKMRYDIEMKDYIPTLGGGRRGRRGRGRGRKERDPNKPKRALSAFFYYANEERARVRAANPDFSVGEVAKELGRQWNELTEDRKVKFERLAEEDRARYDREMTAYRSGCSPMKRMDISPYEDPMGRAKRARTALFFFANEERPRVQAANPDFTDTEVAKELGRMWAELSEDRRLAYERLAQADVGQYYNNMMMYGAQSSPIKKTVPTAFSLFALQERNKIVAMNPGFTEKEVSEELERLWDELDEEVMARYERLAESPNASGFSPLKAMQQSASNGHAPIVLDDDDDDEDDHGSDDD
ncbi:uncharacterized protein LOC143026280 [Oratosquilla oratoria]|uniref:uncharacterized protein LOC143026280 n=1 Tax=Oratosquilla oratoria TaxID=337810 RepID=UPI003F75E780